MVILWVCCGYHMVRVCEWLVNGSRTDRKWLDLVERFFATNNELQRAGDESLPKNAQRVPLSACILTGIHTHAIFERCCCSDIDSVLLLRAINGAKIVTINLKRTRINNSIVSNQRAQIAVVLGVDTEYFFRRFHLLIIPLQRYKKIMIYANLCAKILAISAFFVASAIVLMR